MEMLKNLENQNVNPFEVESIDDDSDKLLTSITLPQRRTYNRWSPMEEGVTLAWRDVNIYVKSEQKRKNGYKRIINNVTGAVKAGSLVALMGTSGSGKSTFMTSLAYRNTGETLVEGDILVNGRPVGAYMHHLSGFMHQDDLFVGSLTVWEHMVMMARLKLDRNTPTQELEAKVRKLLKYLSLFDSRNTRIGLIGDDKVLSGGEKKRLAFATELLTDPQLLFCDEPTTGLDSYSAQKIVTMMNLMAASGKTIVCTIHQPSSEVFALFGQIILLADSRIAFMGSTANAIEFFSRLEYRCPENYNPADFLVRTLAITPGLEEASKHAVKKICDYFAVSEYVKEIDVVVQYEFHMGRSSEPQSFAVRAHFKETLWCTKVYWLIYRYFLEMIRDSSLQTVRILQKFAIALIIGLCYNGTIEKNQNGIQSVQGALFLFVSENTFNPMYSVLSAFPIDRPLFLREHRSGLYSIGAYYISKIAAMLPGLIIESIIFTLISYWLVGLKSSANAFLITTLIVTLTMNVATSCGIFFSNAFDSIPNAMTCLVPFDFVLMITSGLFVKLSSLASYISWTQYFSWLMYSTEALSIVQWSNVQNITCENVNPDLPCLRNGSEVLEKYSFSSENLNRDLWCMFVLSAIFYVLGFACLWKKTKC